MAQEILALTATTTPDNWTLGAGASKVAAVALPDDADTSYINNAVNNTEQKYQVAAPAVVTANDAINFVRIVTVARSTSTLASFLTKLFYSAGTSTSSTHINVPTSYTTYTDDFALAPDGGAWTLTKLQSLFASVRMAANRDMRATSLYVVVDYTAGQNVSASEGVLGSSSVSSSTTVSTGETGAGVEAQSMSFSPSAAETLPAEGFTVAVSVPASEAGAGADSLLVSAVADVSEAGAGSDAQNVAVLVSVGEAGMSDEADAQASVTASENDLGSEAWTVGVDVSLEEHGAGLPDVLLAVSIMAAEEGAGYETVSLAVHTFVIHGSAHVSNESGRTGVTAASDGRTSAEV